MNLIERALEVIKEAPLTPMQRRKKAIIMKRLAPKIARKRKIAMRKKAGVEKIQGRANKAAREYMRQLFLKGKKYTDLPFGGKDSTWSNASSGKSSSKNCVIIKKGW